MKSNDLQELAISHFNARKEPSEIIKILKEKVHLSAICRWTKVLKENSQISPKFTPGWPRTARTKKLIKSVTNRLESKNPRKSLRAIANDIIPPSTTIRSTLSDLRKNPYRKIEVQKLTEKHEIKRKKCRLWMRKKINLSCIKNLMFTDKKIFKRNGYFHPKIDIVWPE